MVVLAESKITVNETLDDMNTACENLGMNINKKKTKCILLDEKGETINDSIEQVGKF